MGLANPAAQTTYDNALRRPTQPKRFLRGNFIHLRRTYSDEAWAIRRSISIHDQVVHAMAEQAGDLLGANMPQLPEPRSFAIRSSCFVAVGSPDEVASKLNESLDRSKDDSPVLGMHLPGIGGAQPQFDGVVRRESRHN